MIVERYGRRRDKSTTRRPEGGRACQDLVISPDNTTIASGDSFEFSAASIGAKQGLEIGTVVSGDFLTAEMVRHQIWLIMLVVLFAIVYVAFRYQCQQDMITIDKMEKELLDAKYKALSSSSTLTEKCRESHVLDALKNNKDSLLHIADQPPYIIYIPE